jgi:hypothetical protein
MAHMFRVLAVTAVIVLAGSCSGPCSGAPPATAPKQHLVFTGPAPGTLTTADVACHLFNDQSQFNALVTGSLDGQDLVFNIQVYAGYKGPGTYQVGSTLDGSGNLRLQVGTWVGSSTTGAGTLIIGPDAKSGVVDANLGDGEHVTGSFTCSELKTD